MFKVPKLDTQYWVKTLEEVLNIDPWYNPPTPEEVLNIDLWYNPPTPEEVHEIHPECPMDIPEPADETVDPQCAMGIPEEADETAHPQCAMEIIEQADETVGLELFMSLLQQADETVDLERVMRLLKVADKTVDPQCHTPIHEQADETVDLERFIPIFEQALKDFHSPKNTDMAPNKDIEGRKPYRVFGDDEAPNDNNLPNGQPNGTSNSTNKGKGKPPLMTMEEREAKVKRALEFARNEPVFWPELSPESNVVLQLAMARIIMSLAHNPDGYIMTENEFAVFMLFRPTFKLRLSEKTFMGAISRYWKHHTR